MKKPSFTKSLIALLLFFSPFYLFSQTFISATSFPADGVAATNPGPTVTITPPAAQNGDLVVIFAQHKVAGATLAMGSAGGQTWNNTTANSGSGQTTRVFWCTFNGTWSAPTPLTVTGGTAGVPYSASIYVFRRSTAGVVWSLNVGATNTTNAAALTLNASSVATNTGNTVTMAFWAVSAANTWNAAVGGAGWLKTGIGNQYRNTTGTGESHTAAYNLQTGTGASTIAQPSQTQGASTAGLTTTLSWAQVPQNDDCANATQITSATSCINGTSSLTAQTLYSATATGTAITSSCTATDNADVWYKFVAQTKFPTVTVSNLGASWGTRLKVQILSGPCGSWTEMGCGNNTVPAASYPIQPTTALTVGTTYYIRIQKNNTGAATGGAAVWAFDICVNDGPSNNDCANAALITSATSCITGTSSLINQTLDMASADGGAIASTCTAANNPDVWYKFVAQTKYPTIVLSNFGASWGTRLKVQLLSGTCGSLTDVGCGNNGTPVSPFYVTPSGSGLTVGNTYYIRILKNNAGTPTGGAAAWAFDICVNDGPSNNDCANAALITSAPTCVVGTSSLTGQTLDMASGDGGAIASGCTAANNPDVWYKFVAQTKYPVITINNQGANWGTRLKLQLLSGSCGSFTEVGCGNNTLPSASFPLMPSGIGLTVGNTYYVRVLKNNGGTPTGGAASWAFDICVTDPASTMSSRMSEAFKQTILSGPSLLADPWEITYGPDDSLWITESKGYKVYRMSPVDGGKQTVLDISQGSTFLPPADQVFDCQFNNGNGAQGGLAGLALHPKFLDPVSPVNFVYISYIYSLTSQTTYPGKTNPCSFFKNRLVRFTYNTSTHRLESPVSLCDSLPGGNDHNSQRIIIAPVGGTYYLFYANGDLGAGQLDCRDRVQHAQNINFYEGKILRFNLDTDGDNATLSNLNNWIPNDNPYNTLLGKQSAVWAIGIRNNQGFAYDTTLHILYGSSHGPYSDDEINIIEPFTNYGHPMIEGYADGNYNGTITPGMNTSVSAGAPFTDNTGNSANPPIGDEVANITTLNAAGHGVYKDPLFSAYAADNGDINTAGTIKFIWRTNPGNANPAPGWPSEAWSGLDLYSNSKIPGWKKSLVAASLKWGRLVRIRLGPSGTITVPSNDPRLNAGDTISYFGSQNRFRDIAFAPNGRDIYVVMDRSTTTSGPSAQWPVVPTCLGCVQKYTFLGYNVNTGSSNRSYIPTSITVAPGKNNTCDSVNTVTINIVNENNNLWVPLTDTGSNVVAEIYAMGQNLGNVTAKVYHNGNAIRTKSGKKYLDRNITITPQFQPGANVKIRLYITKAEYDLLQASAGSGITNPGDVKIFKNNDPCGSNMTATPNTVPMDFTTEAFGTNAYVLQGTISSFSTFYFGSNSLITLPVNLLTFSGSLQTDNSALLKWETTNETNTSEFIIERSLDGHSFQQIGTVAAIGNSGVNNKYSFIDYNASRQSSSVIYYHLKMIDKDGSYTFSDIVTITLPVTTSRVSLYPNPAAHEVNVTITTAIDGKVKWQLIDNTGRTVSHSSLLAKKGNNNVVINLNRLSSGTYFLIVTGADVDQKVKLEKL